jgi:hypothetical protein
MRSHWTIAALLSSTLIAGCNGRNTDNSQNPDQNQSAVPANAPAAGDQTVAPAPQTQGQQPYSTTDNSAAYPQRPAAAPRATTGRRDSVTPRGTTPSQNETPSSTSTYNNAPPAGRLPSNENSRAAQIAAPAPRAPQWREITVPAGTALALEMTSAVSSETAQVEAPVSARLRNAVVINGDTAIPAGAVMTGTVTDVARSGRVQGLARLAFVFNQVRMNNGSEDLKTNPVTLEAETTKGEDATKVGVGAVGGAILGGILGGKKGAGKGAIAGGAAGTGVVLATRGKEVAVTEGTNVTATLAAPLTLRLPIR